MKETIVILTKVRIHSALRQRIFIWPSNGMDPSLRWDDSVYRCPLPDAIALRRR